MDAPSKSAVRKAGSRLRDMASREAKGEIVTPSERKAVLSTIEAHREQFAGPLQSVNMSLRSYLASLGIRGEVTQRLKRMSTILDKLTNREMGLDLSRMRDIGGCRVVTESDDPTDLYALAERIEQRNPGTKVIDYVTHPRQSGYRAIHLEVPRNGRILEVQLRTPSMHNWAETVEAFSNVLGTNFKQDGTSEIHRWLSLLMQVHQAREQGLELSAETMAEFTLLAEAVSASLRQTRDASGGEANG